jgi:hypothetical protein
LEYDRHFQIQGQVRAPVLLRNKRIEIVLSWCGALSAQRVARRSESTLLQHLTVKLRMISLRKANAREVERYDQAQS